MSIFLNSDHTFALEIEGADEVVRDLKRVSEAHRRMAQDSKRSGQDFRDAGQLLSEAGLPTHMLGIGAAAVALKLEIDLAVRAVQFLGRELVALAREGGAIAAVRDSFNQLANEQTLSRLSRMTGFIVDENRLLSEYSQAARARLLNPEELERSFAAFTRGAQATGERIEDIIQGAGAALAGGGMEIFTRLGVSMTDIQDKVRSVGQTMETTSGRAMAFRVGLELLEEANQNAGNQASNLGDSIGMVEVAYRDLRARLAEGLARDQELVKFLEEAALGMRELIPLATTLGRIIARSLVIALRTANDLWDRFNTLLHGAKLIIDQVRDSGGRVTEVLTSGWTRLVRVLGLAVDRLEHFRRVQAFITGASGTTPGGAGASGTTGAAAEDQRRREAIEERDRIRRQEASRREAAKTRGRGGGGSRDRARIVQEQAGDVDPEAMLADAQALLDETMAGDRAAGALERGRGAKVTSIEDFRKRQEDQARAVEDAAAKKAEAIDTEREAQEALNRAQAEYQERIETIGGAASNMASIFGSLGKAVEKSSGKQSAATKALAVVEAGFLIGYNIAKAATEAARAVSAYPNVAEMAIHVTGAALHAAAAITTAVNLGSDLAGRASSASSAAGGGGGGAGAGGYSPMHRPEWSQAARRDGDRDSGARVVIENNGVMTSTDAADEIERILEARRREAA